MPYNLGSSTSKTSNDISGFDLKDHKFITEKAYGYK